MAGRVFAAVVSAAIAGNVLGLLVLVSPIVAATGNIVWIRQFGTPDFDEANSVAVNAASVYVAGTTSATFYADAFLRKYDTDGNLLWTRQFGTPDDDAARAVAADAFGVYVAGLTRGTFPGQANAGGEDAFLLKYDTDGNVLWTRQFGTADTEIAHAVAVNESGVYVAGYTLGILPGESSPGGADAFLRKYDADGNILWTRQFGTTSGDNALAAAADRSGTYVAGYTTGTFPGETSAGGCGDPFLRKYDADGNVLWTRQFGTLDVGMGEKAQAIAVVPSGVYVAGYTGGTFPGQASAGSEDGFLRNYDADGNVLWTRQFGTSASDVARGAAAVSSGVYVAGDTGGSGLSDGFLRKYDVGGNARWTRQFESSANEVILAAAANPSGAYVAGITDGTFPGETNAGGVDAFLARIEVLIAAVPGAPENPQAIPGQGRVSLSWEAPATDGGSPITDYRVYRGTNPASLELIAVVDPALHRYLDIDVTNRVTYHYSVSAVNEIGEGGTSSAVAATPRAPPALTITLPTRSLTNNPDVTIAGTTERDATIAVDGAPAAVNPDGSFSRTVTLPDGAHTFDVVTTDPLGQTASASVTITVDTAPPALTLTSPADAMTTSVPTVTVSGTTEPGVRLVVNGLVVDASPTGSFSFQLALVEGASTITATATDAAGNAATVTRIVTYTNPVPGLEQDLSDLGTRVLLSLVMILAVLGVALFAAYRTVHKKVEGRSEPQERESPK